MSDRPPVVPKFNNRDALPVVPVHGFPAVRILGRAQATVGGPAGHIANTVPPGVVIDGSPPDWAARTLYITPSQSLGPFQLTQRLDPAAPAPNLEGGFVLQAEGLLPGGQWWRRFSLSAFQSIEISVEPFQAFRLRVVFSSLPNFDLVACASSGAPAGNRREPVILGQTVTAAGVYLTPPGATAFTPGQADPGFAWITPDGSALGVTVAEALVAGVETQVKGTTYRVARAGGLGGAWRIRL